MRVPLSSMWHVGQIHIWVPLESWKHIKIALDTQDKEVSLTSEGRKCEVKTYKIVRGTMRYEVDAHRRGRRLVDRRRQAGGFLSCRGGPSRFAGTRFGLIGRRVSCLLGRRIVIFDAGQAHVVRGGLPWAAVATAGGPLLGAPDIGLRRRGRGGCAAAVDEAEVFSGRFQDRRRRGRGRRSLGRGRGTRTGSWFSWGRGALGRLLLRSAATWFLCRLHFDEVALTDWIVYNGIGERGLLGSFEDKGAEVTGRHQS